MNHQLNFIKKSIPKFIKKTEIYKNDFTLKIHSNCLLETVEFLKLDSNLQFNQLIDIGI